MSIILVVFAHRIEIQHHPYVCCINIALCSPLSRSFCPLDDVLPSVIPSWGVFSEHLILYCSQLPWSRGRWRWMRGFVFCRPNTAEVPLMMAVWNWNAFRYVKASVCKSSWYSCCLYSSLHRMQGFTINTCCRTVSSASPSFRFHSFVVIQSSIPYKSVASPRPV